MGSGWILHLQRKEAICIDSVILPTTIQHMCYFILLNPQSSKEEKSYCPFQGGNWGTERVNTLVECPMARRWRPDLGHGCLFRNCFWAALFTCRTVQAQVWASPEIQSSFLTWSHLTEWPATAIICSGGIKGRERDITGHSLMVAPRPMEAQARWWTVGLRPRRMRPKWWKMGSHACNRSIVHFGTPLIQY